MVWPFRGSVELISREDLTHDTVKFGGFVAHWSTLCISVFASTELAEVLGRFWNSVTEELHFYPAKGLS